MAVTTILNLPVAAQTSGEEWVPLVQGGVTMRAQAALIGNVAVRAAAEAAAADAEAAAAAAAASAASIDLGALDAAVAASEASADAAATSEAAAQIAQLLAETARDSTFADASVYPDIATGRAAVADGEQFIVISGNEFVLYTRDSSSTQTEVARYPSAAYANSLRQKIINLGEPQSQAVEVISQTGFLMTSITNPATRRTITRTNTDITIATTQALTAGIVFEKLDQRGGRVFQADFVVSSGASTRAVGIGFTTSARADTARTDASQTTAVDVNAIGTNDTLLFALRSSGGAICVFQSVANSPATELTKIASSTFVTAPVTWTDGDTVRAVAWVPDNATEARRIDFYLKPSAGSTFAWLGNILVNAADWPTGREVWAGVYSAAAVTVTLPAANMTVAARVEEPRARRYMQASAALIGLGTRTEPVSDLRQLFSSVDEGSDNLHAIIGNNGGQPYRIVNSGGFSVLHSRWREVTLVGDGGVMPEIRGSILPVAAWTNVSGNVWSTPNRWNNTTVTNNGGVICYDTSPLGAFHLPGISTRYLRNAGLNVNAVTLNAAVSPSFSPQASGDMWIVLPGGQDPNSLQLELVQTANALTFAGPAAKDVLWRPRVTLKNLLIRASSLQCLKISAWEMLLEDVRLRGAGVEALLQEEAYGITHNLECSGTNGDNHKCNPYTGAGGSSYFTDAARPTTAHWDAAFMGAGVAGDATVGDNTSIHQFGGRQIYHGGRCWDATKDNMSHIDSFEAYSVDCRRSVGGITVAFAANASGDFAVKNCSILDASSASLQITRGAGTGITRGIASGNMIAQSAITVPIGLRITNSASAAQVVLEDLNNAIDTRIATPRSGYASGTVNQPTFG